jgi:hypothetical protein
MDHPGLRPAQSVCLVLEWSGGNKLGAYTPIVHWSGIEYPFIRIWTDGTVEILFSWIKNPGCFQDPQNRLHWLEQFNRIEGVSIAASKIETKSQVKLKLLTSPKNMEQFKNAVQWAVDRIKRTESE